MRKLTSIFLVMLCAGNVYAITLPYSSTFPCASDFDYGHPGYTLPSGCTEWNVMSGGTIDGNSNSIEAAANMTAGGGGRAIRQYVADGDEQQTTGFYVNTDTPQTSVWVRWYEKYQSGFSFSSLNYHKDVYIRNAGGTTYVIPEPYGTVYRVAWYNGSSSGASQSSSAYGWSYINDGNWHCYELHITTSGTLQMWIDENLIINTTMGTFAEGFTYFAFGSNISSPNNGSTATIDYDDVALSATGYIGPLGGDTTAPTVSITTSSPQTITTDSLTVTGTASDAVGVASCKYRIGSEPDGSNGTACTGTTSWSCAASGFSQGANTLYVECGDAVPNWSTGHSITVNYTWTGVTHSGVRVTGCTPY